jgi:Protein of unknown function (DUF1236)
MKPICVTALVAGMLVSGAALAQNAGGAVGGAAGGAAVGGAVGGPAGAAVGGAIGAITGSALPSRPPVTYRGRVVVGQELPDSVVVYPVPDYDDYSYTVIGPRRVIIDRKTRRIVRIIE